MNTKNLATHYHSLTAEERYRLLLAAEGRSDPSERRHLMQSAAQLQFTMPDYAPYAIALKELMLFIYLEILENADLYTDNLRLFSELCDEEVQNSHSEEADDSEGYEPKDQILRERFLDMALATGYLLRTKVEGWKQFCDRMQVSREKVMQALPCHQRLQEALRLSDTIAFNAEGMLCWLNRVRPPGTPEIAEVPQNPTRIADSIDRHFRDAVNQWRGVAPSP